MKYTRNILVSAVVILCGIIVYTFVQPDSSNIKVGVILPLSGQYASIGEGSRNALLLAQEELRADNISLYFEDDKYDAKTAVTAYQKLRSINHVDAVIVLSAPSIQAIAPLTNKDGIPLLGLGETLVHEKDSVFQLMPAGNLLFSTLGKIYGEKYKNIAVVHSNAALFTANAQFFKQGLPKDVIMNDFQLSPSSDYRTDIQKVIATSPDAMTVFLPKEDAIKVLNALRIQDSQARVKIVCDFGTEIAVKEYADAIGSSRLEGCISTNIAPTAQVTFIQSYKEKYNSDIAIVSDYAYDSLVMIQKLALEGDPESWISILSRSDFSLDGKASGKISFNEDGTRFDIPPQINQYRNGVFVPVNMEVK